MGRRLQHRAPTVFCAWLIRNPVGHDCRLHCRASGQSVLHCYRLHCCAPGQIVLHGCRLHCCAWPNHALGCLHHPPILNKGPTLIPNDESGSAHLSGKGPVTPKTSPIWEGWLSLVKVAWSSQSRQGGIIQTFKASPPTPLCAYTVLRLAHGLHTPSCACTVNAWLIHTPVEHDCRLYCSAPSQIMLHN
jgi:hypothetical protein